MEIQGFPDYLVYDDGRVFSKKSRKMLKPGDCNGYKYVILCNQGKAKYFRIHRLVAQHHIPNPNNYPEVDHIDRDKTNNDISNLRWVDGSVNCQNTGMKNTNTSGHKNISYCNTRNKYVYSKMIRGKTILRRFKTLEEAVAYKLTIDN